MVAALVARTPPRPLPAWTSRTFVPRAWIRDLTAFEEPLPTAIRMITEATPIVMPRIVSPERSLLAVIPPHAMRSVSGPITVAPAVYPPGDRDGRTSADRAGAARRAQRSPDDPLRPVRHSG